MWSEAEESLLNIDRVVEFTITVTMTLLKSLVTKDVTFRS
jgi:hypothetical protein